MQSVESIKIIYLHDYSELLYGYNKLVTISICIIICIATYTQIVLCDNCNKAIIVSHKLFAIMIMS